METAAAHQLTLRILQHWDLPPTAERVRVWTELLAELDDGRAGTAYAKARAVEHMTPAIFAKHYKALAPARPVDYYQPAQPTGKEISLVEHIHQLRRESARGNLEATEELGRWHRAALGRHNGVVGIPTAAVNALTEDLDA